MAKSTIHVKSVIHTIVCDPPSGQYIKISAVRKYGSKPVIIKVPYAAFLKIASSVKFQVEKQANRKLEYLALYEQAMAEQGQEEC